MNQDDFYRKMQGYHVLYSGSEGSIIQVFDYAAITSSNLVTIIVERFVPGSVLLTRNSNGTFIVTSHNNMQTANDELKKILKWAALENKKIFRKYLDNLNKKPRLSLEEKQKQEWINSFIGQLEVPLFD